MAKVADKHESNGKQSEQRDGIIQINGYFINLVISVN